jgi:hypothetical protein
MLYGFLADAVVAIHVAYVGFVIVGLFAIIIGALFGCRWVRNFWFRAVHFLMIAVVAYEAMLGIVCPLTNWEHDLRELAGQPVEEGTFLGRLLHDILFVEWSQERLNFCYYGFAALVLGTLICVRPRLPVFISRRLRKPAPLSAE